MLATVPGVQGHWYLGRVLSFPGSSQADPGLVPLTLLPSTASSVSLTAAWGHAGHAWPTSALELFPALLASCDMSEAQLAADKQ